MARLLFILCALALFVAVVTANPVESTDDYDDLKLTAEDDEEIRRGAWMAAGKLIGKALSSFLKPLGKGAAKAAGQIAVSELASNLGCVPDENGNC